MLLLEERGNSFFPFFHFQKLPTFLGSWSLPPSQIWEGQILKFSGNTTLTSPLKSVLGSLFLPSFHVEGLLWLYRARLGNSHHLPILRTDDQQFSSTCSLSSLFCVVYFPQNRTFLLGLPSSWQPQPGPAFLSPIHIASQWIKISGATLVSCMGITSLRGIHVRGGKTLCAVDILVWEQLGGL